MAVLHGMDFTNEVIELLFLGTVMQLYSCLVKWVNIHKMCMTTKRLDLRSENGVVLVI